MEQAEVVGGDGFPADENAPALGQPGERPFDDPSTRLVPFRAWWPFVTNHSDMRIVGVVDGRFPASVVVVPLVETEMLGEVRLRLRPFQHDGVNGPAEQLDVGDVGPGGGDGERPAVCFDQEGPLHARLGPVGRIRTHVVAAHACLAQPPVGSLPLPVAAAEVLTLFLHRRP